MTRGRAALTAAAGLLLLAVVFGRNPHPHMWWEAVPIYGAVFGYAGAWALIWLAKSVLAPLLRRNGEGERT